MACQALILCLTLLPTTAAADCRHRGILIDQLSPAQVQRPTRARDEFKACALFLI